MHHRARSTCPFTQQLGTLDAPVISFRTWWSTTVSWLFSLWIRRRGGSKTHFPLVRLSVNNFGIKSVVSKFWDSFLAIGACRADKHHDRVTVGLSRDVLYSSCHSSILIVWRMKTILLKDGVRTPLLYTVIVPKWWVMRWVRSESRICSLRITVTLPPLTSRIDRIFHALLL
jgi:hypothetical protein